MISMLDIKINHNKIIQKFRTQILMQFVPLPLTAFFRPSYYLSLPQLMAFSLATDFKKYCLALTLNDLASSQKEEKKSENAQTVISSLNLDEIIQGKTDVRQIETGEKSRKKNDSVTLQNQNQVKFKKILSKKRPSHQRARCQMTQVCQSLQSDDFIDEKLNEIKEEQITAKDKKQRIIKEIKETVIEKQRKIKKIRKAQKVEYKVQQDPKFHKFPIISLIDTIDHPKITIDQFEIQLKRENLLCRAVVYDEFERRKYNYQIRERKQLKKLN